MQKVIVLPFKEIFYAGYDYSRLSTGDYWKRIEVVNEVPEGWWDGYSCFQVKVAQAEP